MKAIITATTLLMVASVAQADVITSNHPGGRCYTKTNDYTLDKITRHFYWLYNDSTYTQTLWCPLSAELLSVTPVDWWVWVQAETNVPGTIRARICESNAGPVEDGKVNCGAWTTRSDGLMNDLVFARVPDRYNWWLTYVLEVDLPSKAELNNYRLGYTTP